MESSSVADMKNTRYTIVNIEFHSLTSKIQLIIVIDNIRILKIIIGYTTSIVATLIRIKLNK